MTRELPIFPLPLVLFPGTPLPLHIFEPRYRRLLKDCLEADRQLGVSFAASGQPSLGSVGCRAHIRATQPLHDGRSNIVLTGERRYVLAAWLEAATPYLIARVQEFDDDPEHDPDLAQLASQLRSDFSKLVQASIVATDEEHKPVRLAEQPTALSFQVSTALQIAPGTKQELLSLRSTAQRLRALLRILPRATLEAQRRAVVRKRARGNGTGLSPTLGQDS